MKGACMCVHVCLLHLPNVRFGYNKIFLAAHPANAVCTFNKVQIPRRFKQERTLDD